MSTLNLDRYLCEQGPFQIIPRHKAQARYDVFRRMHGLNPGAGIISPPGYVSKLDLALSMGVRTYSIALAHAKTSGVNVCNGSTEGCEQDCVETSGHGGRPNVHRARVVKTRFFEADPEAMASLAYHQLAAAARWCKRNGWRMGGRLNDYADLRWEIFAPEIFNLECSYYDYTKLSLQSRRHRPDNYHLTWSWHEKRKLKWLRDHHYAGRNVAIVFGVAKHQLPATWHGITVIDGDLTDYRPADPQGVIVGLSAKNGALHGNHTGFVQEVLV